MKNTLLTRVLPPVATFIIAFLALELIVKLGLVAEFVLPPPTRILRTLFTAADLWKGLFETASAAIQGFALSVVVGMLVAILLASSKWAERALYAYAVFFQTVPIIAIAPLLVIWFGYSDRTIIACAFIISVFPIIANTFAGLRSTDPALRDLFRLYGASPVATMLKLQLPFALPNIITGLRIASGLAVIGTVVGEFIVSHGLGSIIDVAKTQLRYDKVYAAVLLASVLGLAMFAAIDLLSRFLLRHWHASALDA